MNWYLYGTLELITTLVSTWYKTTGSCVWRQRAKGLQVPICPSQDFWWEGSQGKLHHSTHGLLMPCRRGRGQHKVGERIVSFRKYRDWRCCWCLCLFHSWRRLNITSSDSSSSLEKQVCHKHCSIFFIAFWVPLVSATGRLLAFDKKLHKKSLFCSAALH